MHFAFSTVGNNEVTETITGVIEGSVLLPCNCSERNSDKLFKWQMEKPNKTLVLKHNMTSHELYGRYKDRVQIFLPEDSNDCSILLTSITAADLGEYRCIFYIQEKYQKVYVYLNISGESVIRYACLQYFHHSHPFTHEFAAEFARYCTILT